MCPESQKSNTTARPTPNKRAGPQTPHPSTRSSTQKQQQGSAAEHVAQCYLESEGLLFIEKNYTRRVGEIDLIMWEEDTNTLVFVEVRFRSYNAFGGAVASIDRNKQRKLIRTAQAYLQEHANAQQRARMDVIALCLASKQTQPSKTHWLPPGTHREVFQGHQLEWIQNAVVHDG